MRGVTMTLPGHRLGLLQLWLNMPVTVMTGRRRMAEKVRNCPYQSSQRDLRHPFADKFRQMKNQVVWRKTRQRWGFVQYYLFLPLGLLFPSSLCSLSLSLPLSVSLSLSLSVSLSLSLSLSLYSLCSLSLSILSVLSLSLSLSLFSLFSLSLSLSLCLSLWYEAKNPLPTRTFGEDSFLLKSFQVHSCRNRLEQQTHGFCATFSDLAWVISIWLSRNFLLLSRHFFKAGPPWGYFSHLWSLSLNSFFVWKLLEKNEKWHHFCAHAQWWSPWRRKNVEKGHLAPSNLTFLLIAIDTNGFRRMKEEGQMFASDFLIFA